MMNLLISLLVFALIFGGALAGMAVRPLLSEHHLHSDSKDVVKLTAGLIGTLTALVLGLLIASAKTTFDQKTNRVRQMTATVILLDDLVTQYGPEATSSESSCGRAYHRWLIAFGTSKRTQPGNPLALSPAWRHGHSIMSSNGYRRTTIRNVPCSLALLRLSRKARRCDCSCLRRPAVQFQRLFW